MVLHEGQRERQEKCQGSRYSADSSRGWKFGFESHLAKAEAHRRYPVQPPRRQILHLFASNLLSNHYRVCFRRVIFGVAVRNVMLRLDGLQQ